MTRNRLVLFCAMAIAVVAAGYQSPVKDTPARYFPPRDSWEHRKPVDVGMDPVKFWWCGDGARNRAKGSGEWLSPLRLRKFQNFYFGRPLNPCASMDIL